MAQIEKCIDSRHHEPCEFLKEYYVGDDGRAKGVDARAQSWGRYFLKVIYYLLLVTLLQCN